MKQFDMIIKNGTVVFSDKVKKTNIAIKDGVVAAISDDLTFGAEHLIDASGKYVSSRHD